ncbi:MAG TPA: tetratricopeptide repeat protein [Candidatus Limnocylindrales bacterium]|nr:tetratricopeptide repeat protein [Candidatus Limnocylindrales bacterium]
MTPAEARDAFARSLTTPEAEMDLAEGALLIAAEEYPQLRIGAYLDQMARMAEELRDAVGGEIVPARVVERCNAFFFEDQGFKGNADDYYDPRNSYLNEVLDRRLGIPITLSVIYVAVGERAGLPVKGVGMPGHFMVTYAPRSAEGQMFIDPFHGKVRTREECATMLAEMYGEAVPMRPGFLEPSPKRQILARILNNLKGIYMGKGDLARALAASDRIMLANPHATAEWRDRGMIEYRLHRDQAALRDFARYLEVRPEPEDAARIRQLRNELLGRLN